MGALLLIAGCAAATPANAGPCQAFTNSYNAYIKSGTDQQWTTYRALQGSLPASFNDAAAKASGDVAAQMRDAAGAAAAQAAILPTADPKSDTARIAITAFQLSVDAAVKACRKDGVSVSMAAGG